MRQYRLLHPTHIIQPNLSEWHSRQELHPNVTIEKTLTALSGRAGIQNWQL